jgi:hypothetical protein
MKKWFALTVLSSFALFCLAAFQNFVFTSTTPACDLPMDVNVRIGRAQIFTQNITDRSVLAKTQFIWADTGTKVSGTYTSVYMPSSRELSKPRAFGASSTSSDYNHSSYYDSTHPDWIIWAYQYGDKTKPMSPKTDFAYEGPYGSPTRSGFYIYPPMDISNPSVQSFLYQTYLKPKLADKNSIALDNASPYNGGNLGSVAPVIPVGGRIGRMVNGRIAAPYGAGQRAAGRTPVMYTGAEVDQNYQDDFVHYMKQISNMAHADHVCSTANNKYRSSDLTGEKGFLRVADAVDISLDETGFTAHEKNSTSCNPTPVYVNASPSYYWFHRMIALQQIAQNPGKGLVVVDKTCNWQDQLRMSYFEWPLANFMLIKGAHSYLSLGAIDHGDTQSNFISSVPRSPTSSTLESMDKIFLLNTGSPARTNLVALAAGGVPNADVYWRQFSRALAVVNPNAVDAKTYKLPLLTTGYVYQGLFDGVKRANGATITLPAKSAKVFIKVVQ